MRIPTPVRLSLLVIIVAPLCAQTPPAPRSLAPQSIQAPSATIPPTAPTAPEPEKPTPARSPAGHAKITYLDHQLAVTADNSSLNQILHEISQLTGIAITGGVTEERVFGSYGPDVPSQVLNQLLDGTSCNVLFIAATGDEPSQLILTPRNGAPTPPSPSASSNNNNNNENADADDQQPVNPPEPPPAEPVSRPAPPPSPQQQNPQNPQTGTPSTDPNGVKTPQQIYDQLMKLRQQQQQQ